MSGSNDGDGGGAGADGDAEKGGSDCLMGKPLADMEGSTELPPLSSPQLPLSKYGRSLTPKGPKGHRFTNLGDAHLAITSRLASRSAGRSISSTKSPASSSSSVNVLTPTTNSVDSAPPAQPMELAYADRSVNGRCLTPGYTLGRSTTKLDHVPREPPFQESHEIVQALSTGIGRNQDSSTGNGPFDDSPDSREPRETGSTVENIYKQYLPSTLLESSPSTGRGISSNDQDLQYPLSPSASAHGDGIDVNYRLEDMKSQEPPRVTQNPDGHTLNKARWDMYFSPGDAPEIPLPDLPHIGDDAQTSTGGLGNGCVYYDSITQSPKSLSDSQDLLGGVPKEAKNAGSSPSALDRTARHQSGPLLSREPSVKTRPAHNSAISFGALFTHPGHPQSLRERLQRESYISHCGLSNAGFSSGGLTSDSDEDPFKFDRGSYTIFLKPSREREVSAALRRVSGISAAHTKGTVYSPPATPPRETVPPVPPLPTQEDVKATEGAVKVNNPLFNKLQFYQTSAVEHAWEGEDARNQIKINVNVKPPNVDSGPQEHHDTAGREPITNGLGIDPFHRIAFGGASDGGDWETVVTSTGQFDSNRACASGTDFNEMLPVKITGSSIADDYSDCTSFPVQSFDGFASTDRILQHPSDDAIPSTRHLRTLKETGRPIFLPKPRIHRVNGYPQDSNRLFTDPTTGTTSSSSAKAFISERFIAPFRSQNSKLRGQIRNVYNNLDQQSKFKSQNSFFSDCSGKGGAAKEARVNGRRQDKTAPVANFKEAMASKDGRQDNMISRQLPETPGPDESLIGSQENQPARAQASPESQVLFDFPLIPLAEAARLQAIRRESGEDGQTYASSTRTRKNSSIVSSRATHKTTPPTPSMVARPLPTHCRRPTPFTALESATPRHGPSSSIDSSVNYGRGVSYMSPLSSGSPPPPGISMFPHSCRNPFSSVHGSLRSNSTFPTPLLSSDTPHLRTKAKRDRVRRLGQVPDLRDLANAEAATAFGILSEDAYLSWEARRRRQLYYYLMCALCIFPFIAPLVYKGTFDSALRWYTKGETDTLNRKQRRRVLVLASAFSAVWLCTIAVVVTLLVSRNKSSRA
ncbi:hypothetical protein B0T24DRAFT_661119 [Lasiosphaeria ovina]|uniref:Uncharacterized protein n=1 Tax=Lasiosphaeria ovina TaxID=92902 RepID=A0AAE0TWP7_9PEZI|nr:hypothetical protein B0T24DRAFT_661119 [Lasiosphaeria ovina]